MTMMLRIQISNIYLNIYGTGISNIQATLLMNMHRS